MGWDATTQESTSNVGDTPIGREPGLALVVLWSRDEPWRAGEVMLLPPGDRRVYVFGRGDDPPEDPTHHRLRLVRQRPGHNAVTPPLGSPKVSRAHLRIQRIDARSVTLENIGRRSMLVRGKDVHQAVLSLVGRRDDPRQLSGSTRTETVTLQGELLLLLIERPQTLPSPLHMAPTLPGFGAPCELGLIGESAPIWELRDQLAFAAQSDAPTLVHGLPGAGLDLLADAAQRARPARPARSIDLAAIPPESHRAALFSTSGLFAPADAPFDVIIRGLDALAPTLAPELARVLVERRVVTGDQPHPRPFEGRVIATTSRLESLSSPLRGPFHHLVRATALADRRDDLPFLVMTELRDIFDSEALFRARHPKLPAPSLRLMEALALAPLDGGLPALRASLIRSLALSSGPELTPPPELGPIPAEDPAPLATPTATSATPPPEPAGAATPPPADVPAAVLAALPELTKSERVVLQHLARNKTSREIAKTLFVSVRTVQNHRARICDKLGLRGNNALLGIAVLLRDYLGPPPDRA